MKRKTPRLVRYSDREISREHSESQEVQMTRTENSPSIMENQRILGSQLKWPFQIYHGIHTHCIYKQAFLDDWQPISCNKLQIQRTITIFERGGCNSSVWVRLRRLEQAKGHVQGSVQQKVRDTGSRSGICCVQIQHGQDSNPVQGRELNIPQPKVDGTTS